MSQRPGRGSPRSVIALRGGASLLATAALVALAASCSTDGPAETGTPTPSPTHATSSIDGFTVTEFPIIYPVRSGTSGEIQGLTDHDGMLMTGGSTHEITFDQYADHPEDLWITDQNSDSLVKMALDGSYVVYPMPAGSGPHGSAFDPQGRLWLTLQFSHELVQVDDEGVIQQTFDLTKACPECGERKPGPHGLAFGPDGVTLWYAAKDGGYIGVVRPDGTQEAYPLPDPTDEPIYVAPGPDGNMWFTEYHGSRIGRITPDGVITEFATPTPNSGPISIHNGPDTETMWFSEEYGNRIGRVDVDDGSITEFEIPRSQPNMVLAALEFDAQGNLWLQQWVDPANPEPAGPDSILRVAASFFGDPSSPVSAEAITVIEVPSRNTGMHRVIVGPDGNVWFTELNLNTVGRITQE
jgi:virginiamycin B lyase